MSKIEFIVEEIDAGKRLDKYIADLLSKECSRMQVKNLIKDKHVVVNNDTVKAHYSIQVNDRISIDLILPESNNGIEPEDIPINIIYEDLSLLILNKSYGMVVHPGAGNNRFPRAQVFQGCFDRQKQRFYLDILQGG